jgi:hypothetical protein
MRFFSTFSSLCCVLSLLLNPFAAGADELNLDPATGSPALQTCQIPTVLTVSPLKLPPDDVAEVLDVRLWKFRLETSAPGARVRYSLQLMQDGKLLQNLCDGTTGELGPETSPNIDHRNVEALVGFHKKEGKWSAYIRVASGSSSGSTTALSGFNYEIIARPAEELAEGSFQLTRFGKSRLGAVPEQGEMSLVVNFQLEPTG